MKPKTKADNIQPKGELSLRDGALCFNGKPLRLYETRTPTYDPPDLEEQWIKYGYTIIKEQNLSKSQINAALAGLRHYSHKPGKASYLVGELNKRLEALKR